MIFITSFARGLLSTRVNNPLEVCDLCRILPEYGPQFFTLL